ncbi:MAG: hypothetical protein HY514_04385 [Candidatus Aenigmarchaeota archaeon]|nr:hypothetical protein [Candidatus Aenigmarchaeota archaeon]
MRKVSSKKKRHLCGMKVLTAAALGAVIIFIIYAVSAQTAQFIPPTRDFVVCEGPFWNAQKGDEWIRYSCREECADWKECTYLSDETDARSRKLQMLAFVSDEMAGEIRFNQPSNDYRAALLMHQGAGGTFFMETASPAITALRHEFEKEDVLVIDTRWRGETAMSLLTGWWTRRSPDEASTLYEKAKRPAQLIKWIHDNIVPQQAKFGTIGCSGGSMATFSSVYWHGLDPIVDYQLLGGGPPMAWDVGAECTGAAGEGQPLGVCEENPAKDCSSDQDCASRCATPQKAEAFSNSLTSLLPDYIHNINLTCSRKLKHPAFDRSSYRFTGGDWEQDSPTDFLVDIGKPDGSVSGTDTEASITYMAGMTYRNIRGEKYWLLHNGKHCSWASDVNFMEKEILPRIKSKIL